MEFSLLILKVHKKDAKVAIIIYNVRMQSTGVAMVLLFGSLPLTVEMIPPLPVMAACMLFCLL